MANSGVEELEGKVDDRAARPGRDRVAEGVVLRHRDSPHLGARTRGPDSGEAEELRVSFAGGATVIVYSARSDVVVGEESPSVSVAWR